MIQKFQKELGWKSYTFPVEGETAFIVYNPEVFKSKEAAPSDTKESRLLFAKAMPLDTRKELGKEISNIKDINKYEGLTDDVIFEINGALEENKAKTYNQVFNEIKNITSKTLSVASQNRFETDLLKSLFKISEGTASK